MKEYTLVLDLDETLIHYFEEEDTGRFYVRPNCFEFLREMARFYEVVIFTAGMQDYADWVLDQVDQEGWIKHRLYRQHAIPIGQAFVKVSSNLSDSFRT